MPMKAPTQAHKERPLAPAGTHVAIMYKLMNLGTRIQMFQGKLKEHPDTLVTMTFELPNERVKFTEKNIDGDDVEVEKPLVVSREFTFSMGPKSNLRPFVEGMIGTKLSDEEAYGFDLEALVGTKCLITLVHKKSGDGTKTYANVTTASPLMKGLSVPEQFNKNQIQDVNTMSLDEINKLPPFLQDKIKVSDEYRARFATEDTDTEINPENIPF